MSDSSLAVPGLYVLGMHRSGTSVVAGLVDRLGLDGGPRASMLSADKFNSDGYWEQRPLVEWHDQVLAEMRGWASAPPPAPDPTVAAALIDRFGSGPDELVSSLFSEQQWFLKDPRQCLLLWLWDAVRGDRDLAVVVFRSGDEVARSLAHRNNYSPALGLALWERYCHDLLVSLEGRPCMVLRYGDLTGDPDRWVSELADSLDRHLPRPEASFSSRVDTALPLVRRGSGDSDGTRVPPMNSEQRALTEVLSTVAGYHEAFRAPSGIPDLSEAGTRLIDRRRARLNRVRFVARSSGLRARADRVSAVLRDLRHR